MWRGMALGSCLAVLVVSVASGQAPRGPATLDDLLAELRALRADLTQSHLASARTQLAVGRAQVQELRVGTLRRELAEVQFQLRIATEQRERTESTVTGVEQAVRSGNLAVERRRALDAELAPMQERLGREQQSEHVLRARESDLANAIAFEQGRWNDVNARLDDLERALSR